MKIVHFVKAYLHTGLCSFSASANHVLHQELVERHKFLQPTQYLEIISFSALVPGPFHINLVIATGYAIQGFMGAVVALIAFVLPGFLFVVMLITQAGNWLYQPMAEKFSGATSGILASVAGLVLSAAIGLARKNSFKTGHWLITAAIALLLYVTHIPFPIAILAVGIIGCLQFLLRTRMR